MAADETVVVSSGSKPGRRLATMGVAVIGAALVWLVATQAFGVELRAPAFDDDQTGAQIGVGAVLFVSLLAGSAAWGLLALLERVTAARARLLWTVAAAVVLVLSLGGPLSGSGTTGDARATLVALHLVVGAVLITGLVRSARAKDRR